MKLSAPPPPPPEPEAPGDGQQPATPPADAPAPPAESAPPPPAEAKAVTWPAWFAGADFLLAVLALTLAFMAASFVARNSDLWLHLAAGKRLLSGEYTPGTDPFSFSGANRTWVNHSLLFDVGAYLLYGDSGSGAALVVAKALFAAAAFGLLIAIRRPGFSLWPWAAVAAVAVVACAPYLHVRPIVGSVFLLALTLLLLFRPTHAPGSWRFPASFGVVCWVWANVDEWFFIGPLAVALVLAGELIQRSFGSGAKAAGQTPEGSGPAGGEPLGALPDVPTLAKALAVGLLACMLNPHNVGVWQLPFELVGSPDVQIDPRFKQLVLVTPLAREYTGNEGIGNNVNGLAYAVLFVAGGAVLGWAAGRTHAAHIALWLGFALLSLQTIFAIPFFAVVAVPLLAGQLNAVSSRVRLGAWSDPKTRFLLLGSAAGRVLVLVTALAGCVLAWPGWVHPPAANPAFARRVAWGVEPDPALAEAARQLQAWREAGRLPADSRGVNTSLDFANHCAWFAPLEKVFVNTRYNHHRPEWADYEAVRLGLRLIRPDERPDPQLASDALGRVGAGYVTVQGSAILRDWATEATASAWVDPEHWSVWYVNGRVSISGWRPGPGVGGSAFDSLRLDPVALAFGPGVERVPAGSVQLVRPRGGWEEEFLRSPGATPLGADEAFIWLTYREVTAYLRRPREGAARWAGLLALVADRVLGLPNLASRSVPPVPPDERAQAAAFLALRAARRAVAEDPDHPDGYYTLAQAMSDPHLPISESDRVLGQIAALRQCLERTPAPENFRRSASSYSPAAAYLQLALLYAGPRTQFGNVLAGVPTPVTEPGLMILTHFKATGALVAAGNRVTRIPVSVLDQVQGREVDGERYLLPLDVVRDTFQRAQKYAEVELADPAVREKFIAEMKGGQKMVESELARNNNSYEAKRVGKKLAEQVGLALQLGLSGEALRLLTTESLQELGPLDLDFLLCRVALELALGRLEDAAGDLEFLGSDTGFQQRMTPGHRVVFRSLVYRKCVLEGNYPEAGRLLEEIEGPSLREEPTRELREKFDPRPYVGVQQSLTAWANYAPLAGLASPTAFDLVARSCVPGVLVFGYQHQPTPNELLSFPGFLTLQQEFARFRAARADFFFRRATLYLLEGDIAEAESRLLQTRADAVESWGLPAFRHGVAEHYLGLIAEARRLSQAK